MSTEDRSLPDLPPPAGGHDSPQERSTTRPENGAIPFPLFSETPFGNWHLLHRKQRELEHVHPSCTPVIKLWDEANGA